MSITGRALEGELERSVMSLAEVEQARVHLTFPKDSVFLEPQQPAKASVLVKIRPGQHGWRPQNVLAIDHLVASAVEGLAPEAVSVLDMNGNLLGRPKPPDSPDSPGPSEAALDYRHKVETDLLAKINSTLEPLLGANKFRAGVSVECDFTGGDQSEEIYDPARSVMTSSQRTEDNSAPALRQWRAGNRLQPAPPSVPAGAGAARTFARHREHPLSIQPHGEEDPPAGRHACARCRWPFWWIRTSPGRGTGTGIAQGAGAAPAGETENHPRPGGRSDRVSMPSGAIRWWWRRCLSNPRSPLEPPALPPAGRRRPANPAACPGLPMQWNRKTQLIAGGPLGGPGAWSSVSRFSCCAASGSRNGRRKHPRRLAAWSGRPTRPAGGLEGAAPLEKKIEAQLAERDALQQKSDAKALEALKLAPVITKKAEVLAKHLRDKITKEPEIAAQVLRTWIREEEST